MSLPVQFPPGYTFRVTGGQRWCVYSLASHPCERVCIRMAETWESAVAHLQRPTTFHVATLAKLPAEPMSLAEWSQTVGIPVEQDGAGCRCVTIDPTHPHKADLWRLTDCVVSSVSGPVIRLTGRPC
jgi:hypothetical protein